MNYYYDSNDSIVGLTYNGTKYLYIKSLQNDVIRMVDTNGNIVVKYYYDGYGTLIDTIDTSGINLSSINPFRYRNYYRDDETGWYYLNSRYYNPLVKRFITMDDIDYLGASGSVLSYNLFSYCENNPVVHRYRRKNWLARVVCGVIGATAFALLANVVCKILGLDARTKAIQEIEKRKFSLKAIGPNLSGNIFGIVISNVLIIMLHSPHPKYNEWYFHIQVEVKLEGRHQVTIFKYPLLYVNHGKWGK